jgi:hypothetical protein
MLRAVCFALEEEKSSLNEPWTREEADSLQALFAA